MAAELVSAFDGTPYVIPVIAGRAFTKQTLNFDGQTYILRLYWNQLQSSWTFSLYDFQDDPIIEGQRLVTNWPLLRYVQHDDRCPPGELVAQSLTTDNSPPAFDELGIGKRVELTYFSATS